MRCSKCGTENEEGNKFCKSCGESLELVGTEGINAQMIEELEDIKSIMIERRRNRRRIKDQTLVWGAIVLAIGIIVYTIGFFLSLYLSGQDYTDLSDEAYNNIISALNIILFLAPVFCFTGIGTMIMKFYKDWKDSL